MLNRTLLVLAGLMLVSAAPLAASGDAPELPVMMLNDECRVDSPDPGEGYVGQPCQAFTIPGGAHCDAVNEVRENGCTTYYLDPSPFQRGSVNGGITTAILWQESNGCEGLQRGQSMCNQAKGDTQLLV